MKQKTLGKPALVLSLCAIFMVAARYSTIRAQQVGPGGAPGAGTSFTCDTANNCAALNAANTFSASQAIASGSTLQLNGFYDIELSANTTHPTGFTFTQGSPAGYMLQFYSEAYGSVPGGVSILQGWCYQFHDGIYAQNQPPSGVWCEPADDIFTMGSNAGDTSGWLQVAAIGNGASGNTDLRGHLTLASGTAAYTFTKTYTVAPTCVATDTTTTAAVKVTSTTSTLTLTGTGTDTLNYLCAD